MKPHFPAIPRPEQPTSAGSLNRENQLSETGVFQKKELLSSTPETGTLLLMTNDTDFTRNLRNACDKSDFTVKRVATVTETIRTSRSMHPTAVLLDLDLPGGVGWETADRLLLETNNPPIILLTNRAGQFNFHMAIRTGSIVDKSLDPLRLLNLVKEISDAPRDMQAERCAIQRVVLMWLKPLNTQFPTPAYRDFGINE